MSSFVEGLSIFEHSDFNTILSKIYQCARFWIIFSHSTYYLNSIQISRIPEAKTFGRNRKFSAFGLRFWLPKVKAEYDRNSRKALDFFFPSVFQDGLVFLIHFWQLIFASTLTLK